MTGKKRYRKFKIPYNEHTRYYGPSGDLNPVHIFLASDEEEEDEEEWH